MDIGLLVIAILLILLVLIGILFLVRRAPSPDAASAIDQLTRQVLQLDGRLTAANTELAILMERSKGDLRQEVADRLADGFAHIRTSVEKQMTNGREEQAQRLSEVRKEVTQSLGLATAQFKDGLESFNQTTAQNLDAIRDRVDSRLSDITQQVQQKLDQNIKEGFAQFEKVQQHLKAAEEQLREVGTLGHSINDLNNLLKLPHLRGTFGEASLERLLSDFLPANMFEIQGSPGEGGGRADAVIFFPDRKLPIDAKFPREQVLALFEGGTDAEVEDGRTNFVRVMKAEAKRIRVYIQPENGTTDIALMYLPSETLYMEAIRNRELADWLNQQHVFPVSPNTLLMTLKTIALVHKWYEVASRFEQSRLELGRAQKSFEHFQNQFETVGKNLSKAQEAFDTASKHLKTYRGRVTALSGQEQLELDAPKTDEEEPFKLTDRAS